MVQKKSKTAPQNDLRHQEIESVFSNASSSKSNISQKELESRVNQIYQVFEGSWNRADIRRTLEENEYNVEDVITLRFEGRDQWTEVKKKPTAQQIRISKPKSSKATDSNNVDKSGVPSSRGRGGGRGGRGGSRGGGARRGDRTTNDDKSSFDNAAAAAITTTGGSDFFEGDNQTSTATDNNNTEATSSFFESSESAFFDQGTNDNVSAASSVTPVTLEENNKARASVPPRKKRVVNDKPVSSSVIQPTANELPMSYSQAAAIHSATQKPQPVQEEKPKKQKKPKQPKQTKQAVSQPPQPQQQEKAVESPVQQQESVVAVQQRKQPVVEEKKVTPKQSEVIMPSSQYQLRGDINVKFGSLDLNDEQPEEEIKPQEQPQQQQQQPSAPQITATTGRRQSQQPQQQQQPEVQQPTQQQLPQDYGYANTSGWGEEQNYHYQDTAVNQQQQQQFHDQSHFFNYPQHPQQHQQPVQDTGKGADKTAQDPNAQNAHKQQAYTGYPMHPYGNPHMQGYPSYPYGGYPHPYMLPNQYAQQQYGYGPTQTYPKFGYKGVYGYGSTSPTYGSTTPPADEKGAQQQQQQQQQQQHHAQQPQYSMMHQPQFYMMHHQQFLHDPSTAATTADKTELGSSASRSPQNIDAEQQATFYPYHMPYNQYVYTGHPHSNLFAPPQQGTQANPSNAQQRGSSNDSWSN
jgi:hypothetical protein